MRMSTPTSSGDVPIRTVDRFLAFTALGLAAAAIVCFFAVIIARPAGVTDFSEGIWPLLVVFPAIALPVAFLMIVALLIMSFVRRARANREG
jgi:TRAP-type C4-dicarboxylate transport system permease small subunit